MNSQDLELVNITPHEIVLNDGTKFPPTIENGHKVIARIETRYNGSGLLQKIEFGEPVLTLVDSANKVVETRPLPPISEKRIFIVSGMMSKSAIRPDFYAHATGHADCVRNEKGHVVSVPFLVQE